MDSEKAAKERKPIQVLRERRGGMSEEFKSYYQRQVKLRKELVAALKGGPKTVPELARALNLPGQEVIWHLMALRKYGEAAIVGQVGDYVQFGLKEA